MPGTKSKSAPLTLRPVRTFSTGDGPTALAQRFVLFGLLTMCACSHAQEQSAASLYWAGIRQTEATNYAVAVADFTRAIQLFARQHDEANPTNALAYNNRGFAREKLNDHTGALADLSEAIRLNP